MKSLVVYYSRSNNTETVAKEIAKAVKGEIKKIELIKEVSFFWAAVTALLGKEGKIKHVDFDFSDYENIFIGSPVWAGKTSTPINTFLNQADFTGKNVYVFLTQADEKTPSLVFESMTARIEARGGKVKDHFFMQTNMKSPLTSEQVTKSVEEWLKNFRDGYFRY
jgi:flavodoxin